MDKHIGLRNHGYYWLKGNNEWLIGYYDACDNSWTIVGNNNVFFDNNFDEIDEKQIEK